MAVITAYDHHREPVGFTATSLTSVSADPPLVSFNIANRCSSWPALPRARHITLHLLGQHQTTLAAAFARKGADRFAPPTRWHQEPHAPLLGGVLAWLACRIIQRVPAGDHHIIIAQATTGSPGHNGRPLLYHHGHFTTLKD